MHILPDKIFKQLQKKHRTGHRLALYALNQNGETVFPANGTGMAGRPFFRQAIAYALRESVRWGDVYTTFLAPDILFWVVPVVDRETVLGGLTAGAVRAIEAGDDFQPAVNHLVQSGFSRAEATKFVRDLPKLDHDQMRAAADGLFLELYALSGLNPYLLSRNRENALQQRRIAEAIQERKALTGTSATGLVEERRLLSLIRVGDRNAARGLLNDVLASLFLYSPRVSLIKARMIELMGYLVRAAVEDSPSLEPLIARQQKWINAVVESSSFEDLCEIARGSLDDFIQQIETQGYHHSNRHVTQALAYMGQHFDQRISLDDVARAAGISRFRIVHLVKEITGQSIFQHIKRMRVKKARQLLEQTDKTCADLAYDLGFSDQSSFIRQFQEITGATPARFRKARQG